MKTMTTGDMMLALTRLEDELYRAHRLTSVEGLEARLWNLQQAMEARAAQAADMGLPTFTMLWKDAARKVEYAGPLKQLTSTGMATEWAPIANVRVSVRDAVQLAHYATGGTYCRKTGKRS